MPMETSDQIHTIFLQAEDRKDIEELGKTLSASQFLELLSFCPNLKEGMRQRLNPLLVGLVQSVFYESLPQLTTPQLQTLCRVADDEPLQYHLALLIHELFNQAEQKAAELEVLHREIEAYDVSIATQPDIDSFRSRMLAVREFFRGAFERIDIALAMAWNSNREELIDKLTTLKENWLRYVATELGAPSYNSHPATGIYLALDQHFGAIYSGTSDGHPLAALVDTDSAFDALTALSVWYVEDYWEIGLLPGIEHVTQLQLDPQHYDQNARREFRERLTGTARLNLTALGLLTVADLKSKELYSRRMLMRFIQAHQHLLKSFSPP